MNSLDDFNLLFVKDVERGTAVKPICYCRINDKVYNPSNATKEEDIYIPLEWLKEGCVLTIDSKKASWFVRMKHYVHNWYLEIWNIPYNTDSHGVDRIEIFSHREDKSFVMI